MLATRQGGNLVITGFDLEDLMVLRSICRFRYFYTEMKKSYQEVIDYYKFDSQRFITSMSFLYEILDTLPHCQTNIQSLPHINVRMRKTFTMWSEQADIIRRWWENKGRSTISAPTGSGKTIIGLQALYMLQLPTLIVVPTVEVQTSTWMKDIVSKLGIDKSEIGRMDAHHRQIRPITITTYHSGYQQIKLLEGKFDLVIFDEAHHAPAKCFKDIVLRIGAKYYIGLSATVKRHDHNESLILKTVGPLVQGLTFKTLVKNNRISPFNHRVIMTDLTSREGVLYAEYFRRMRYALTPNMKMKWLMKAQRIACCSSSKLRPIMSLVSHHQNDKVLIFTRFIDQAKQIDDLLKPYGSKLLVGNTKKDERRHTFEWFKSVDHGIIVTSTVLDEGINVPDARIAIIASGFGTARQNIQRVGRTVRFLPEKVAQVYEIVTRDTFDESLCLKRNEEMQGY